jgi:hypothetical protein
MEMPGTLASPDGLRERLFRAGYIGQSGLDGPGFGASPAA